MTRTAQPPGDLRWTLAQQALERIRESDALTRHPRCRYCYELYVSGFLHGIDEGLLQQRLGELLEENEALHGESIQVQFLLDALAAMKNPAVNLALAAFKDATGREPQTKLRIAE